MTIVLTLSFILMAAISCLVLIKSNTNPILKAGLILVTIWYGIALYFLPGYFMGFPKQTDVLPNDAWVLTYRINEPSGLDKGGMHFWVIEDYMDETLNRLNPMDAFRTINAKIPRAYTLPYDREMHKQLEDAIKKGKESGEGGLIRFTRKEKGSIGEYDDLGKAGKFQIVNPSQLLPSKD